jgi:hypothetical protein
MIAKRPISKTLIARWNDRVLMAKILLILRSLLEGKLLIAINRNISYDHPHQ